MILKVTDHQGKQFNVPRTSAENQRSLLLLLGSRLSAAKQLAETKGMPAGTLGDVNFLVGTIMALPKGEFTEMESLLNIDKLTPNGEQNSVDLKYFSGNMVGYFHVLAGLVRENLQDFFTWLNVDQNGAATE
jgi:hypothetical protein